MRRAEQEKLDRINELLQWGGGLLVLIFLMMLLAVLE
jgi:hypothetical protein